MNFSSFAAAALALSIAAPAGAQTSDPPSASVADNEPRHEVAATALGGLGMTEYDYYDRVPETAIAWGVSAEYGYRLTRHFRVGIEGARTAIYNPQRAYGSFWTAMPFVGLHFGGRSIEVGLRAGLGPAYGGREPVRNISDRSGFGLAAQAFAELAVLGSKFDFIGRLGLRYTRVAWTDETQVLYPTELPVTMAFVSIGGRFKL